MSWTIVQGKTVTPNLGLPQLKRKEAMLRAFRKDYTIIYPAGTKIHCEHIKT
mgnify:CR=1 FL=1